MVSTMDDDRDPFTGDRDDDDTEAVARAFEQIAEAIRGQHEDIVVRFEAQDRAQARNTELLGDLIKIEYAGELARLGEAVDRFMQYQVSISEHLGVQQKVIGKTEKAIRALHGVSRELQTHGGELGQSCDRLEKLGNRLDGIVARPAEVTKQRKTLLWFCGGSVLAGVIAVFLGLWALPDEAETRMAATIMGDSYWDSSWRMMDMHSEKWANGMRVLTWVDTSSEEAQKHRECRDRAVETGENQECVVVFWPGSGG